MKDQIPNEPQGDTSTEPHGDASTSTIDVDPNDQPSPKRKRGLRLAIIASVIFHIVLVTVLVFWYLPQLHSPAKNAAATSAEGDADSGSTLQATPESTASVPDELIETSIQMQIDQANELSDQEKLSDLEKNLKRLESISSAESVNQITEKVGSSLGLDSQQYQPKKAAAEGDFDTDTAQMTDVTRSKDADGRWVYRTVMVDAQGRQLEVPISATDGEPLYQTFENIKKFPMASGIYRSVVMPMMQKIIRAQDAAAEAAKQAERIQQQQSEAPNDEAEKDVTKANAR